MARYEVVLKGGSIGESKNRKPCFITGDRVSALAYRRRMNKVLSPGEKSYYGLKYVLKSFEDEPFTPEGAACEVGLPSTWHV